MRKSHWVRMFPAAIFVFALAVVSAWAGDEAGIDSAKAQEIALEKTGGGTVVKFEREVKRDGRIVFEVEILGADRKYEVKLDGRSGDVIAYEEDMRRHRR